MSALVSNPGAFRRAEQRIGWLTLALGLAAGVAAAAFFGWRAGLGVAVGTVLAWISYRWLQQALDGMVRASVAQHERAERSQPVYFPLGTAAKLIGRYALIAAVPYVIVTFYEVPVLSVLSGLFALGAATMVEGVYEAVARAR